MDDEVCLPSGEKVSDLKVTALRNELKKRRLSYVGKKKDLVKRLTECFLQEINEEAHEEPETGEVEAEDDPMEEVEPEVVLEKTKKMKKSKKARKSHDRFNETFEMIEDEETVATVVEVAVVAEPAHDSFLSEDGVMEVEETPKTPTVLRGRRSSDIRRSVLRKLGFSDDEDDITSSTTTSVKKTKASGDFKRRSRKSIESRRSIKKNEIKAATPVEKPKKHSFLKRKSLKVEDKPPMDRSFSRKSVTRDASSVTRTPVAAITPVSKTPVFQGLSSKLASRLSVTNNLPPMPPSSVKRSNVTNTTDNSTNNVSKTILKTPVASEEKKRSLSRPRSGGYMSATKAFSLKATPPRVTNGRNTPSSMLGPLFEPSPTKSITEKFKARRSSSKKSNLNKVEKKVSMKSPGRVADRFGAQHKQLLKNMPTLEEADKKKKERLEEMNTNVPDVIKRLTTPTRTQIAPVQKKIFGQDPMRKLDMDEFKFGVSPSTIALVQKKPQSTQKAASTTNVLTKSTRTNIPKLDVKQLGKQKTRKVIPLTKTVDTTVVNYLSTPKDMKPEKVPARKGYTPRRGAVEKYIDTTKLSDSDYVVAVQAGLVKPKVKIAVSALNAAANRRAAKRDAVLDVRRKLNV